MAETESSGAGQQATAKALSAEDVRVMVREEMGRCMPDALHLIHEEAHEVVATELGERDSLRAAGWALLKGAAWAVGFVAFTHLIAAVCGGEVEIRVVEPRGFNQQ